MDSEIYNIRKVLIIKSLKLKKSNNFAEKLKDEFFLIKKIEVPVSQVVEKKF